MTNVCFVLFFGCLFLPVVTFYFELLSAVREHLIFEILKLIRMALSFATYVQSKQAPGKRDCGTPAPTRKSILLQKARLRTLSPSNMTVNKPPRE